MLSLCFRTFSDAIIILAHITIPPSPNGWSQYVEATKASDGPGSHCSACFKRLDREPCSKYIDVMPVLHLCEECREQPRKSSHSILLASLGPRRQVRVHLPCSYLRLSYDVWHHYEHATTVCGVIARCP